MPVQHRGKGWIHAFAWMGKLQGENFCCSGLFSLWIIFNKLMTGAKFSWYFSYLGALAV